MEAAVPADIEVGPFHYIRPLPAYYLSAAPLCPQQGPTPNLFRAMSCQPSTEDTAACPPLAHLLFRCSARRPRPCPSYRQRLGHHAVAVAGTLLLALLLLDVGVALPPSSAVHHCCCLRPADHGRGQWVRLPSLEQQDCTRRVPAKTHGADVNRRSDTVFQARALELSLLSALYGTIRYTPSTILWRRLTMVYYCIGMIPEMSSVTTVLFVGEGGTYIMPTSSLSHGPPSQ